MTHNDFTAAKFRAPFAVYCGSVPKTKPGYTSLRNGSIDSNLQLCGNRWGADTASLQTTLSLQMKRSYLWGGDEGDFQPEILPPPLDLAGKNESQLLVTSSSNYKIQKDQEVDSAALETTRLKDKLKRKMSEGFSARGVAPELSSVLSTPLKPAVPRSASQRLLNITKPVPPIQRSTTPHTNAAEENGTQRNGLENMESIEGKNSQNPSNVESMSSSAERKWKSHGGVLIPPIPKSSGVPAEPSQSDTVAGAASIQQPRNSPVPGQGASQRSAAPDVAGKSHRSIVDTDQIENRARNDITDPLESLPVKRIVASSSTDISQIQQFVKNEEGKENTISFTISKSAQDKMRQKQQEMENFRNEKRRSQQQLPERSQEAETGEPAAVASFGLGTVPIGSDKRREGANIGLNKWVSRTSLPSIPTVNPDPTDFRHSSAYSLPATFLDCFDWDSDSENGGPGSGPMSHPEQGMIEALKWLHHKDWEQKEKGLLSVRCLASWHPEVLFSRLHDVCIAVTREVSNLRSKVSRHAIKTLGDLFKALRRNMDQEVEEITRVLLHKIGDSNDFIREESDKCLGIMVEYVSPSKAMSALLAGGSSHRNSSVRKCMGKHLLLVVEQLGVDKVLSGPRESTDTFLRTLVKLVQDGQQDTRFYGRRIFSLIMTHPKFEGLMERLIPPHDLRDLIAAVKQKEMSDSISDIPSARRQRPLQKSSVVPMAQDAQKLDQSVSRPVMEAEPQESPVPRRQPVRAAEVTEQLKELHKLLTAKEYQNKMDGVTLLLEHCKSNVKFVTSNVTQIFDAFNPRMQDANKKVNQYALESAVIMIPLLKDSLHHVLVPMMTVVTDNLNSKHTGIYTAAGTVLDTLIANIGLVPSVYPRKPQAVERHVLPVLWFFLSNITGNGVLPGRNGNFKDVVTKLAKTLHRVMGPNLQEYATGQPQHVIKMLADILGTKHE